MKNLNIVDYNKKIPIRGVKQDNSIKRDSKFSTYGRRGETRTLMGVAHTILSRARLPVPPLAHILAINQHFTLNT